MPCKCWRAEMAELISASVKVNRVVLKELISCKIPIQIFEVWKKWWPTKRKLLKLVWEGIKVALNIFPSVFRLSLKSDCLKPLRNVLVRSFNCSAALTHTHTHTHTQSFWKWTPPCGPSGVPRACVLLFCDPCFFFVEKGFCLLDLLWFPKGRLY